MRLLRLLCGFAVLSLILWAGSGCYETKYPLGSAGKATVNPAYVGDFLMPDEEVTSTASSTQPTTFVTKKLNTNSSLIIRNIDGHRYYVELSKKGENALRMVGYTTDIKGATIAILQWLQDDGSIPDKYFLMRVSISADHKELSVRDLNDEFFDGKKVDSAAALQSIIESNLDNDQMFEEQASIATRVEPAKQN